jgi:1-acyl-sn-glycerol-3-phosphate acyltransferase
MFNILVIVAVFVAFVGYDLLLSLSLFLHPSKALDRSDHYARLAVGRIFKLTKAYCRTRLEYENFSGLDLPERFLLVTNHQSLLDIPVCIALFPERRLRFVAKRELGDGIPLVSLILRSQGHALVRRKGDSSQAMRSVLRFARRCNKEGTCPVIFPEGTRSRDGEIGAFHTAGVRKILNETPLPLVVAVIDGGWRVATVKDVVNNLGKARFRLRVLSVTSPLSAKREVLEALAQAREALVVGLAALRAEPKSGES